MIFCSLRFLYSRIFEDLVDLTDLMVLADFKDLAGLRVHVGLENQNNLADLAESLKTK